jgi:hypothetical protein
MTVSNAISDTTENNILKLIFNATSWTAIAVNHTTTPDASTALALHTADPGDAGTMATSEMTVGAYTSYARTSKLRAAGAGGWTVTANSVSPFDTIAFPAGTGGTGATATHFSVGKLGGGSSEFFWRGDVTPTIACGNGVTPQLTTGTTITID